MFQRIKIMLTEKMIKYTKNEMISIVAIVPIVEHEFLILMVLTRSRVDNIIAITAKHQEPANKPSGHQNKLIK